MMCELIFPRLPRGKNDLPSEQPQKIGKEVNYIPNRHIWSPQTSFTHSKVSSTEALKKLSS